MIERNLNRCSSSRFGSKKEYRLCRAGFPSCPPNTQQIPSLHSGSSHLFPSLNPCSSRFSAEALSSSAFREKNVCIRTSTRKQNGDVGRRLCSHQSEPWILGPYLGPWRPFTKSPSPPVLVPYHFPPAQDSSPQHPHLQNSLYQRS